MKFGRNDPCGCGRLAKYKHCCYGKVDWNELLRTNASPLPYLSARGRNKLFLGRLAGILQLDSSTPKGGLAQFKKAFTPSAVREIHGSVADIWADKRWIESALTEQATATSALYIGGYHPERVFNSVGRVSLYSERILLPDPFPHPKYIRPEYSPINVPEQHLGNTLRWSILWLTLAPWIEAGIVCFVRTLGDLDPALDFRLMDAQRAKFDKEPRLKKAMDEYLEEDAEELFEPHKRHIVLSMPDKLVERYAKKMDPSMTADQLRALKQGLQRMKDSDPYYIDPRNEAGEQVPAMMMFTTGANLEEAKLMANLSGSHLLTDLRPRWVEIELDREAGQMADSGWSSFSKAFQGLPFRYLDNVPLNTALELRKEDRLSGMRLFLRKVWKAAVPESPYSDSAVQELATELKQEVASAEAEWDKIDRDLLKWFGSTSGAGAVLAPLLGTGAAGWAAAGLGVAMAAATQLAVAWGLRDSYAKRYPAGFFLDLQKLNGPSDR